MQLDPDRIDQAVLALLYLGLHNGGRPGMEVPNERSAARPLGPSTRTWDLLAGAPAQVLQQHHCRRRQLRTGA
jgi:hypothetical protein